MVAREKLYGQHVCLNAKIAISKNGEMKEVGLAHAFPTLCNNAWIDVVAQSKLTPTCKTECQECLNAGRVYRGVFKERTPKVMTEEQKLKLKLGKQLKLNSASLI
jgi:hypothetical protein